MRRLDAVHGRAWPRAVDFGYKLVCFRIVKLSEAAKTVKLKRYQHLICFAGPAPAGGAYH